MKNIFIIALAILLSACNVELDNNMKDREKYWENEISTGLRANASQVELALFLLAHSQKMDCYQNYEKVDICDFTDSQSKGGFKDKPLKLAVMFKLVDEKVVSHSYIPTNANVPMGWE
jgi:hypothetical protein